MLDYEHPPTVAAPGLLYSRRETVAAISAYMGNESVLWYLERPAVDHCAGVPSPATEWLQSHLACDLRTQVAYAYLIHPKVRVQAGYITCDQSIRSTMPRRLPKRSVDFRSHQRSQGIGEVV